MMTMMMMMMMMMMMIAILIISALARRIPAIRGGELKVSSTPRTPFSTATIPLVVVCLYIFIL